MDETRRDRAGRIGHEALLRFTILVICERGQCIWAPVADCWHSGPSIMFATGRVCVEGARRIELFDDEGRLVDSRKFEAEHLNIVQFLL